MVQLGDVLATSLDAFLPAIQKRGEYVFDPLGVGRDGFLAPWLRARGVDWAADLIPNLTNLADRPESAASAQLNTHPTQEILP